MKTQKNAPANVAALVGAKLQSPRVSTEKSHMKKALKLSRRKTRKSDSAPNLFEYFFEKDGQRDPVIGRIMRKHRIGAAMARTLADNGLIGAKAVQNG
jgi:hypothetical protein